MVCAFEIVDGTVRARLACDLVSIAWSRLSEGDCSVRSATAHSDLGSTASISIEGLLSMSAHALFRLLQKSQALSDFRFLCSNCCSRVCWDPPGGVSCGDMICQLAGRGAIVQRAPEVQSSQNSRIYMQNAVRMRDQGCWGEVPWGDDRPRQDIRIGAGQAELRTEVPFDSR